MIGSPGKNNHEKSENGVVVDESVVDLQIYQAIEERKVQNPDMDRLEEIKLVQDICKECLRAESLTEEMKKLYMDKLVQIGLEKQNIEDDGGEGSAATVRCRGHCLELQRARGRNPSCEVCLGTIWKLVHLWRKCKFCGVRVHDGCSQNMQRECAAEVAARPGFSLRTEICEERGLAQQGYRCAECAQPLAFESEAKSFEPRLCDYSGLYFCSSCHWNDEMAIPARLLHNLDAQPRLVSRAAKQLLTVVDNRPLLAPVLSNPQLVRLNSSLKALDKMRRDFLYMKCYFISCAAARHLRILQHLYRHQHFVEDSQFYSVAELRNVVSGRLLPEIIDIHAVFRRHIEEECETCRGNGFYCQLCSEQQIIFPFTEGTEICGGCYAVMHDKCFRLKGRQCPRCERRRKKMA